MLAGAFGNTPRGLKPQENRPGAKVSGLGPLNVSPQAGSTSFTDTNAIGPGPFFYRVGVEN